MFDRFLSEHILVYITGVDSSISTEDGQVADVPMLVEGILYDHDYDCILIGSEDKSQLSIINKEYIVRIDLIDKASAEMGNPLKPDKNSMS